MIAETLSSLIPKMAPHAPVRNHLMVREYDEQQGVYYLVNQAVAFCFEMDPIGVSSMSVSGLSALTEMVSQAIGNLPEKASITITSYRTKIIDRDVERYQAYAPDLSKTNPVLGLLRTRHLEKIQGGVDKPLMTAGPDHFSVRKLVNIGCIILQPSSTVSLLDAVKDAGLEMWEYLARPLGLVPEGSGADKFLNDLSPQQRRFHGQRAELTRKVNKAAERVMNTLMSNGISVSPLRPNQLIMHLRGLMHPNTGHRGRVDYDPTVEIYNQVAVRDVTVDRSTGAVASDGVFFRVASLRLAPEVVRPGHLSRPDPLLKRAVLDYLQHGHITISATRENTERCQFLATDQMTYAQGELCPVDRREKVYAEALRMAQHLESGSMFSTTVTAVCYGSTQEDADRDIATLCDRMTTALIPMRLEEMEGPRYFFQSLPLNYLAPIKRAQRDKLMPDTALACLWPIYGFGRGHTGPRTRTMVLNRAGEPFHINLHAGGNSPHTLATGMNGVGKSFVIGKFLGDHLCATPSQAYLIDFNNSFANKIGALGPDGSVNNLGGQNRTTMNVFRGTLSMAQDALIAFLSMLATPDGVPLNGEAIGKINKIITLAFRERQQLPKPFLHFDELAISRDIFVDKARKRLVAKYIDYELGQSLNTLRRRTEGRVPVFEIWYRYYVHQVTLPDENIIRDVTQIGTIPKQVQDFLRNVKGCLIEHLTGDPVTILCPMADHAGLFATKGLSTELDVAYVYVDVERREDADEIQNHGVKYLVPPSISEALAAETRDELLRSAQYANATNEALEELVRDQITQPPGSRIYDFLVGEAVLQNEVFFSDFGAVLDAMAEADDGNKDSVAINLQSRLSAYYGQGTQAAYFDGPTGFDLERPKIIGFELSALTLASPHMQSVVVAAVLQMINVHAQSAKFRGMPKMLIFDEAHRVIDKPGAGEIMSIAWRELRKFGCECIAISQGIEEFMASKWGRVIVAQSPNRLLLKQEPGAVPSAAKALELTPEETALYGSLDFVKGLFSEVLWINKMAGICEVFVYIAESTQYWTSTSDPHDTDYRRQQININRAQYPGTSDQEIRMITIGELADAYPNGYFHTKQ